MLPVRVKHISGDRWEVSLPSRKSALRGRPALRPRRTVHAPDEEAAREAGEEVLAREYAAYKAGTTMDLVDLVEYYLAHAEQAGIYSSETARDYLLVVLRYVEPYFAMDADRVLPVDIERLYGLLMAEAGTDGLGVSANTVRKLNTVLRATYAFLVREGIVASSPMNDVRLPRYERHRRRALTERELGKLESALGRAIAEEEDVFRRNCLFGAYIDLRIGARVAEVCAITRGDVSLSRGEVMIDEQVSERGGMHMKGPKTTAGRRAVAIGQGAVAAIRAHLEWQKGYLTEKQRESERTPLCTDFSGGFIRPSSMSSVFKGFCGELGIELADGESFHLLRHTNASQMLGKGVGLVAAQKRLGHARGSTTIDNYGHENEGENSAAADEIEESLRSARDEEGAW